MSMFSFFQDMEDAAETSSKGDFIKVGINIIFMIAVLILSYNSMGELPTNAFLVIAALFGAYMAMNIGANNVGPAWVLKP